MRPAIGTNAPKPAWTCLFLIVALPVLAAEPLPAREIAPVAPNDTASARLDLRAPDISTLFTREEIDRVIRATRDPDTIEEVEVQRERSRALPSTTPDIPPGIFAPFWALVNPTQAWRIFLPLPPDQARSLASAVPDATESYREPTLPPQ